MKEKDKEKIKKQLITELAKLRQKIFELKEFKNKIKQTEKTFVKNLKRFKELFNYMNNGAVVYEAKDNGRDFIIKEFNRTAEKIEKVKKENIIEKSVLEVFPGVKDFGLFKVFQEVYKTGKPQHHPISLYKDQRIIGWRENYVYKLSSGEIIVVYNDITERKQVEEELKNSEERLKILFDYAPDVIYISDLKGRFIDGNKAAERLIGYKKEELIGKSFLKLKLLSLADIPIAAKTLAKSIIGKPTGPDEFVLNRKDNSKITVEISTYPVKITGRTLVLGIARDITERKKAEILNTALYNISRAANSEISLNQLYPLIHKELNTIIDATNFFIALVNYEEDRLFYPYHKDEKDNFFPPQKLSSYGTLTAYIIKTGQSLLANRNQIDKMVTQEKIKLSSIGIITPKISWLGVPLKIGDKIIGAMVIQKYNDPYLYSNKDIKLMEFVSDQITTAIQRKQLEEKMEKLAYFDSLTGAYNRGYGLSLLDRELKFARRRKTPSLLTYIDIDKLKYINDTFGHEEGDKVLEEVVKFLKSTLREVDIICRMGGDEFLIIFPDNSLKEAPLIKERLNRGLIKLDQILKKPYKIEISMGFSCYDPNNPQSMDELIRIADKKMYDEKKNKK